MLPAAASAPLLHASPPPGLPPLQAAHNTLTGVESLRVAAGAGSNTLVAPARVADYQPCHSDVGGFFDDKNRARRMAVKKVVVKECSSSSADAELSQAK